MKLARFRADRRVAYGVVEEDEIIEIRGSIYTRFRMTDTRHKLEKVRLLAPTDPTGIMGPGLNFADRLEFAASIYENGKGPSNSPEHPEPWMKGRGSMIGHMDSIIIPRDSEGQIHYEGEAVAVIGKVCRRVTPEQAGRFILGYTCGNDVSDRTWQRSDRTPWRAKGADTFAPVGPWIETDIDPQQLELIVRLNGKEKQRAYTKDMLFPFHEVISYISQHVTLRPGDLVYSGTTGSTSPMKPGDTVEVEISGIGVLRNPVTEEFDATVI